MGRAGGDLLWVLAAGISLLAAGCQKGQTPTTVSGLIEMDEAHLASRYGGRVEIVPVLPGLSTTGLVDSINRRKTS